MEHSSDISSPDYQTLIGHYQKALNVLKDNPQPQLADILDVLLARDAIHQVSPQQISSGQALITLQELDQRLKDCQALIADHLKALLPLKKQLGITSAAWWWPSPHPPKQSWLSKQDWLWQMGSIIFLSASASLVLNTAARFWGGGIGSAGTLPIVAQSVLTLVAGKGALTASGREAWQKFLKKQNISEAYWHEWSFGAAGAVFVCVAAIHGSLPWVATWYNDWGWQHYQSRRLDSALSDYQTALSLRPDYPEAQFHTGLVYEDLQQYDQAKEKYQVVVESDLENMPLDVWLSAHNNLARLYLVEGNERDAAPLLIRAQNKVDADLADTDAKIADVNYNLLKNLGWVRLNQQRYDEAKTELLEAIDFDQNILQAPPIKDELIEMSLHKETGSARAAAYCLLAQVEDAQQQLKKANEAWDQCLSNAVLVDPDENAWVGMYELRELETSGNE
ncbi:MAG: tetratricopeptide repeat protein [Cyanobacteria bacterium P01_C01_bin.118]